MSTHDHDATQGGTRPTEDEMRFFFEHSLDLLCVANFAGWFTKLNPAWETALGYTCEELMAVPYVEFIHPDDIAVTAAEAQKLSTGALTLSFENRFRRRDGGHIWLLWHAMPDRDRGLIFAAAHDITAKKIMEQDLRRTTQLQQAILDGANFTIISGAPDGIIQTFNAEAERKLGYAAAEVIGKETPAIIHDPEEVVRRAAVLSKELGRVVEPGFETFVAKARLGMPDENEWTYIRKDGSRYPVLLSVTALMDKRGQITGFLGVGQDITARKLAEEQARGSQTRLQLALDAAQIGDWELNLETHEARRSLKHDQIFGYAELLPEWSYEIFLSHVHPDDRERVDQAFKDSVAAGKDWYFECRVLWQDRSEHHIWARGGVYPDAAGRPTRMLGMVGDITDRKRAEEAHRTTSDRLLLATQAANVGIWDYDVVHQRLVWDDLMYQLYGITAATFSGAYEAWESGLHPDDKAAQVERLQMALRGERDFDTEFRVVWPDGTVRHLKANGVVQRDSAGNAVRMIGTNSDITAAKLAAERMLQASQAVQAMNTQLLAAKAEAERASHAKSEFLAQMSHEIRTPMNGIIGMTGVALNTQLTPEQREYLNMVRASADALLTVINDVLDFSKIEAGRLSLDCLEFRAREIFGDTMKTLANRANEKSLELACHFHAEVPDVLAGDPGRLRQIIVNLVGNAIKFTHQGEVVLDVRVEAQTDAACCLHFTVSDTGIGIPAHKQQLIFDAFTQADSSTTREYGGTGLGLAISARLVGMMGGRIWVESELHKGSTFHFTAQLQTVASPATSVEPARQELLNALRVLVVDDNATNRRILEETLNSWHMLPTLTDGGAAAIAAMQKASQTGMPFGLVLLDFHMPKMDGFTVAAKLREMAPTPIVMLTSGPRAGDAARSREMGISSCLTKPVKQSELLDSMLGALNIDHTLRHPPSATAVTGATPAVTTGNRLHVLVAEDNAVNQKLASLLLQERGHSHLIVPNGREALAAFERESFDCVLMDVQMPEMDGFQATAAIREREKIIGGHVPIIAMTAHALKGDRERCLAAGMDGYVSKPIQPAELWRTMAELLPLTSSLVVTAPAPAPAESHPEDAAIRAQVLKSASGSVDFMRQLAQVFIEESATLLSGIHTAIANGDAKALQTHAHSLKGALALFGSERATAAAQRLETIGHEARLKDATDACATLDTELLRLRPTLERMVA